MLLLILLIASFAQWVHGRFMLVAVLLLIGTLNVIMATYDVYADTVKRTDERSDAFKFAALFSSTSPKCIGGTWFMLALMFSFISFIILLDLVDDESQYSSDH